MRLQVFLMFSRILKLSLYKCLSGIRICRNTILQMWLASNFQNNLASVNRSRKVVIGLLIAFVILLYIWPSWLPFRRGEIKADQLELNLDAKLSRFRKDEAHSDVIINHDPLVYGEHEYLSYVGNGYIASAVETESQLHLHYGRFVSIPVPYFPMVAIDDEGFTHKDARVLDIKDGIVYEMSCFEVKEDQFINIATQIYAHRYRPSILVQEHRIHNPTDLSLRFRLNTMGASGWDKVKTQHERFTSTQYGNIEYTINKGTVPVPESTQLVFAVAIASVKVPTSVDVKSGDTWTYQVLTAVKYSEQPVSTSGVEDDLERLSELAQEDLKSVLNINIKILREEHTSIWNQLWMSGFGISESKAQGYINGNKINSTIYYVMSNVRSPMHEYRRTIDEKTQLQNLLYYPETCYNGHHTLQNTHMWGRQETLEEVHTMVKMWIMTLEKQGCASMLKAGADGVLQAMILSLGALQFKDHHLEFRTEPKDLHRDYFFRRINYGNNTHVNMSVILQDDNKASIFVALDRNEMPYYACDAGCLDAPVKLSKNPVRFPVKITDPFTAILYITSDFQHMEDLKHVVHVKEVKEAPAHEHHVIALHKHGHHLGGLPTIFWVAIALLILIFHLFLFKLVFNEYCQADTRYSRKYNL